MVFNQGIKKHFFDYIYPWGENLKSITWAISATYHWTLQAISVKYVFVRDIILILV